MNDPEVQRLRDLRNAALRLRAMARRFGRSAVAADEPVMQVGACAGWRLARAVTGRLRAHPFEAFQKDAGVGIWVSNALAANFASLTASTRLQALHAFHKQLRIVSRQLDDARALAWAPDFSDLLARSQSELRKLAGYTENALHAASEEIAKPSVGVTSSLNRDNRGRLVTNTGSSDWPFVAL